MDPLPPITVPATPRPATDLKEHQQNVSEWAKSVEQNIRKLEAHIRALQTNLTKKGSL